jgi:hypothetical protein
MEQRLSVSCTISNMEKEISLSAMFYSTLVQFVRSHLWLLVSLSVALLPVLATKYFITNDGASHVYNAALINELISSHPSTVISSYFRLNPFPVPNYISYFILEMLLPFFTPQTAEKIFIIIYTVGFTVSLYFLIRVINPDATAFILAAPLLVHNRTFMMGFYNFSFAFIFLFISMALLIKNGRQWNRKDLFFFFISNTLLYFSHPVILVLLIIYSAVYFFFTQFSRPWQLSPVFTYLLQLIGGFIIAAVLFAWFLSTKNTEHAGATMNPTVLWSELNRAMALWIFDHFEYNLMRAFLLIVTSGLIIGLVANRRDLLKGPQLYFIIVLMITVVLYFYQPSSIAGADLTTYRLQFAIYCMMFLCLVSLVNSRWMKGLASILGILALLVNIERTAVFKAVSAIAEDVQQSYSVIPENSVVMPLVYNVRGADSTGNTASEAWLFVHCYDYVGALKHVVLLGNYEASTYNFPVLWKPGMEPVAHLRCASSYLYELSPCADIPLYESSTGLKIEYIPILFSNAKIEELSDGSRLMLEYIFSHYSLIYSSGNEQVKIYRKN